MIVSSELRVGSMSSNYCEHPLWNNTLNNINLAL